MKLWFLSAAIVAVLASCATTTSSTGRKQFVGGVSQEQLNQLGAQAFTEAKSKGPLSKDAKQNAYVRCVVNALVRQLPAQTQSAAWETAVFADKEPNAFALPGGKVGVNTGIFTVAKNQDQLAAVLAHEIGHVVEHHHDERITRQMGAQGGLCSRWVPCWGRRTAQGARRPSTTQGGSWLRRPRSCCPVRGLRKRSRRGRAATDGRGWFRSRTSRQPVAEHDRRRGQPSAAMVVDPS